MSDLDAQPLVFVVDDDAIMRKSLANLLRSVGLRTETFGTAREFLDVQLPNVPCCAILDVRLPGISGLDIQARLASMKIEMPLIFVSAHGDIPMTVRAIKAGAIEFLPKPFREQELLDAVQVALENDKARHERARLLADIRSRFDTLTPREQEVMVGITSGLMNKQVAGDIGISEDTVKVHRGNAARKMGAKSLADLVRMADQLGLHRTRSQ
jgi:FixJ family two-component response regulator